MIINNELSARGAKDTLPVMIAEPSKSPRDIAKAQGLLQQNDLEALRKAVERVMEANKSVVEEYKTGKTASLQYLIGHVMKETRGTANPGIIKEILLENLR